MRVKTFGWGTAAVLASYATVGLYGQTINYNAELAHSKKLMADNVYFEGRGEPMLSEQMIAYVTDYRAQRDRSYWGGSNIGDVVVARANAKEGTGCQFNWACEPRHQAERKDAESWERAQRIAQKQMAGEFTPPPRFKNASNYLNVEKSSRSQVCWFKTHLVRLGPVEPKSDHVFYREPESKAERLLLPKRSQVPECRPKA